MAFLAKVNNASFYGAEFFNVEDAGTAHISVLSPAGSSTIIADNNNICQINFSYNENTGLFFGDIYILYFD